VWRQDGAAFCRRIGALALVALRQLISSRSVIARSITSAPFVTNTSPLQQRLERITQIN